MTSWAKELYLVEHVPDYPVDENGWAQMNIRLRPELRAEVDAFCEEMDWPRHVFLITALYVFKQIRQEAAAHRSPIA